MELLIVWTLVTGSLFTWACDSPFNIKKEECREHREWKEDYYKKTWRGGYDK